MAKLSYVFFATFLFFLCFNITEQDRGTDCCPSYCTVASLFMQCLNYQIEPTTTTTKKVTTTTKKTTKKATTTTKKTTKKTTTTTKKTTTTTKKTTTTTTTVPPTKHSWNGTFTFGETIINDQAPCCVHIEYDDDSANASSIACVITSSTLSSPSIIHHSTETTLANADSRTSLNTEDVALEKYTPPPNISQSTTVAENTTTNAFFITQTESSTTQNLLASQRRQYQSTLPTTITAKDLLSTSMKLAISTTHKTEDRETTQIYNTLSPTLTLLTTKKPSTETTDSDKTRKLTTERKQTFSPTPTVIEFTKTNPTESVTATSQLESSSSVVTVLTLTDSRAMDTTTESTSTVGFTSTNKPTDFQFSSSFAQNSTTPTTEHVTTESSSQMTNTTIHFLKERILTSQNPSSQTTQNRDIESTLIHVHTPSADSTTLSTSTFVFATSTKEKGEKASTSPSPPILSPIASTSPASFLTSESTSIRQRVTYSVTPLPRTTVTKSNEEMAKSTTRRDMKTSTTHAKTNPTFDPETTNFELETSESVLTPTSDSASTPRTFLKITGLSLEKSTTTTVNSVITSHMPETSERSTTTHTPTSTSTSNIFINTTYSSPEMPTETTSKLATTTNLIDESTIDNFQEESSTTETCICANSGTCNTDGLCVCADGYFGASCDLTSPSPGVAAAATAVAVVTAVSQSSSSSVKFLWPRYSASVRMPTNPHEFFRLLSTYFLTVALGVNSMFGVPKSSDVKHMPMCAMSYLFRTGAFFLSLTSMIFEAGVDALTLSGAKFNAWTRPAERRPRCFSFWPTAVLYVLVGVAPTAGLWLKHWTDCVTTRSCIGSLGYGDFDRSVKNAAWLQLTVTLFYLGMAFVIGIFAIACNSFDICRCRRRTEAWSINPYVYGREIWPLEANAYFWLVAIQPVLFGVCWMSYMHVNDAKTVKAQWINLILTSIYSVTSTVQSSLTTSQQLSNTVCSLMTMLPQRFLFLMPSTDHVSLKDKKGILKDQMHAENWKKFELKELNDGPVPAYPIRYDSIPFGLVQYMCRLWTTNYIKQRANGATIDIALTMTAKHFLLQLPDLRTINTFQFAHLFCNWAAEVREKDSDSISLAILQKSLRIMDRQMDLSVPPPMIVVKECGTDTEYRRKISHLTPMDGEDQVANSRKASKHCDVSLDDTQPAFIGPKTEEHSVSALVPHELFVAFNMDDENIDANMQ